MHEEGQNVGKALIVARHQLLNRPWHVSEQNVEETYMMNLQGSHNLAISTPIFLFVVGAFSSHHSNSLAIPELLSS